MTYLFLLFLSYLLLCIHLIYRQNLREQKCEEIEEPVKKIYKDDPLEFEYNYMDD